MKMFIDGDSCCAIKTAEAIASKNNIECHIYCDSSHIIKSDYSEVHIIQKGANAVDFAIVNVLNKGDVIITNDAGLAALALAKKGFAVNTFGMEYTNRNIMSFLNRRYIYKDAKRKCKRDQVHGRHTLCKTDSTTSFKTQLYRIIKRKQDSKMHTRKERLLA